MLRMNTKRIAGFARDELTGLRRVAIYALLACTAFASAFYSCSQPQPPKPLAPTAARIDPTQVPPASAAQPPTIARAAPPSALATPRTENPAPQLPIEPISTPTPNTAPKFVPRADAVSLPEDISFTQISAGKGHACGIQIDGTALCWAGANISGSLNVPDGLTFRQISAGLNFTCGLRNGGAIACWGENNEGQASPPDGIFDEIATGRNHACAIDDGALICWGSHFPDGAATIQEVPPLSAIQAGYGFTCGLTPDADMACLNNGDRKLDITPGPFTDIGIGLHHVCAIRVDGSALCNVEDRNHLPPPSTKFAQISGGWHHTCGITEASLIECWGSGVPGATGERLSAPKGEFTAISIGWRNTCALNADGHAVCWQQPDIQPLYPPDQLASAEQLSPAPRLSEAFGGIEFEQPVELFPLPDGRLAVVERKGLIAAYSDEPNAAPPKTILDLTDETICCIEEEGMLSAALDPQFESFPFLYVYYNVVSAHVGEENMSGLAGRLARFRLDDGKAVRDSELTILDAPQLRRWHNGGAIRFGADGMLYLGIGDDGLREKAQSLDTLTGKIIRIDVRGATPEQPYRIPIDNPFVDNSEARPEIWAYGLRNPWRMDFAPDGRLFIADAGYQTQEEVSIATAGANLGWPMCEGNSCKEGVEPDAAGLTAPIIAYGRPDGCAIIGGVTAPRLNNGFVFGDLCNGRVWLLEEDAQEGWRTHTLAQAERNILSFGIGADGTIYVLAYKKPIMRLQFDGEE